MTAESIASSPLEMQKKLLGESLFPAVVALLEPKDKHLGGKVTGMLLEMDNSELFVLLESPEQLGGKVDEAVTLLRNEEVEVPDFTEADEVVPSHEVVALCPFPSCRLGETGEVAGAESVELGVSVPCALLAQATLEGRRLIDSRAWTIPHGWYALHAASRPVPPKSRDALRNCWPDAPEEQALLGNVIGGLIFIEESRTMEECGGDAWATGPVCHLVSKAITLCQPIRCAGASGMWPLPPEVLHDIQTQLPSLCVTYFDLSRFGARQSLVIPTQVLLVISCPVLFLLGCSCCG